MPDLCIETMDSSGEFQNLVVTGGIVQKGILENVSLLESEQVEYSTCHAQSTTQLSYCTNRKCCGLAIAIIIIETEIKNKVARFF